MHVLAAYVTGNNGGTMVARSIAPVNVSVA